MLKKIWLAAVLAAVMSATVVSARQLQVASDTLPACGSACSKSVGCQKPCLCFVFTDSTTGFCQPEGPPPPPDMRK